MCHVSQMSGGIKQLGESEIGVSVGRALQPHAQSGNSPGPDQMFRPFLDGSGCLSIASRSK